MAFVNSYMSASVLIFPDLGIIAYPCLVISFIAEVSLALWLSIKAVKPQLSVNPE